MKIHPTSPLTLICLVLSVFIPNIAFGCDYHEAFIDTNNNLYRKLTITKKWVFNTGHEYTFNPSGFHNSGTFQSYTEKTTIEITGDPPNCQPEEITVETSTGSHFESWETSASSGFNAFSYDFTRTDWGSWVGSGWFYDALSGLVLLAEPFLFPHGIFPSFTGSGPVGDWCFIESLKTETEWYRIWWKKLEDFDGMIGNWLKLTYSEDRELSDLVE